MLRAAASLLFYSRFFSRFSTRGLERRMREWRPYSERLDGQTWLVTGASGGIGRAIALAANARGASVLAVARDADKLATLRAAAHEPARLQPLAFDLSLVRQTRRLADAVAARGQPLAVLVNNVGVLLNTFTRTTEGLEASLATNLLNHVVLTEALHDGGALDPRGVVVNMSSGGMYGARLDFDTLLRDSAEGYDGMAAYAQHKRAQVELTRAWNGNWGGRPAVHVMHPGWVDTDGVRSALPAFRATLRRFLRDADQGADTALWLGTTRPRAPREGGIWLDRVLDPEHEFGFTRNSAVAPAALLKRLRGIADAI
jgi:dehydrogenase/reductase SDR family protein 12